MPATSPAALARKRDAYNIKRKQQRHSDPAYAARALAREQRSKELRAERASQKRNGHQFVGCDGEGVRRADGRSDYVLFRMGTRELGPIGADQRRLITPEILEFICRHPDATDILVGFSFEYDISNILRDVPWTREKEDIPSRLERLLAIDTAKQDGIENPYLENRFGWTWLNFDGWPQFGVSYIPRNYLKVCRAETITLPNGKRHTRSMPGSARTIFDTFGFFQCSFLKALDTWDTGPLKVREAIKKRKEKRSSFTTVTAQIRRYCKTECDLLAQMMEKFRTVCLDAGLEPRTWNGAGKLAAKLHNQHATVTKKWLDQHVPAAVIKAAHAAYYGGRFEVTRVGAINQPVYEHDIKSAYPAAMAKMPCLEHGKWIKQTAGEISRLGADALFICGAGFSHPREQFLCGVPFRDKSGKLQWPRQGNGVYWSVELKSAERLGATITYRAGYAYQKTCDCHAFEWIDPLFRERQRIAAKNEARGIPIKLGLNSLYGKLAQRVGTPKWQNPIWAGLITAMTRAKLNDAIASVDQKNVIMIATDAIYTVGKAAKVARGDGLGQWDVKQFPSLFIVKPGLYWPPRPSEAKWKLKSRGLSPKFFEPRISEFEARWNAYMDQCDDQAMTRELFTAMGKEARNPDIEIPVIPVTVETFVGLRLAFRQGNPDKACQWLMQRPNISFDWSDKRLTEAEPSADGGAMVLRPKPGSPALHSLSYTGAAKQSWLDQMGTDIADLFEAMPDHVDLSIPFK